MSNKQKRVERRAAERNACKQPEKPIEQPKPAKTSRGRRTQERAKARIAQKNLSLQQQQLARKIAGLDK